MNSISAQDELVSDLCRQAEERYRSGDNQGAQQVFEAVLQIDPSNEKAREGLALTSLKESNWQLVDRQGSQDQAFLATMTRARESLASGLLDDAYYLAEDLVRQYPGNPEAQALLDQVEQAQAQAPQTAQALGAAREALDRGDRAGAADACRQVLAIEPGNREAEMLLEQIELGGPGPADGPKSPFALELDLDLVLPAQPPAPAPRRTTPAPPAQAGPAGVPKVQSAPAPAKPAGPPAMDKAAVVDLMDAARDLHEDEIEIDELTGGFENPGLAGEVTPDIGEAAMLVARGRQALAEDRLDEARNLAAQALAITPTAPGAQELLHQSRVQSGKTAQEAEELLNQAIAEFERGRPDLSVPLLKQVLDLIPGHLEAQHYLQRAQVAEGEMGLMRAVPGGILGGPVSNWTPPSLDPELALDSVLTPAPASTSAPTPTPVALNRHEDGDFLVEEGVASIPLAPAMPADEVSLGPQPPLPELPLLDPPVPIIAPAPRIKAPAPQNASPPPPPPPPPAAEAPAQTAKAAKAGKPAKVPKPPKVKKSKAPGGGGISPRLLVGVLGATVVLAGAGYGGWKMFGPSSSSQPDSVVEQPVSSKKPKPVRTVGGQTPGTSPNPGTAPAEPPAPVYTSADVPKLLVKARLDLAEGRPAEAAKLLEAAQKVAPNNNNVSDLLDKARMQLGAREAAEGKIKEIQSRWKQEDFEEALRMLYRIPQQYQPAGISGWIANGWYNLGLQRLQTGDLVEASEFLNNCLEVRPDDDMARKLRQMTQRYRGKTLDGAYWTYVRGLDYRALPK